MKQVNINAGWDKPTLIAAVVTSMFGQNGPIRAPDADDGYPTEAEDRSLADVGPIMNLKRDLGSNDTSTGTKSRNSLSTRV